MVNDRTSTDIYDANGNTTFNGQQNVYDFENRLVRRGGVSIIYDGDGNRVQETVAGVTTKYLVGEVNPTGYVQVFAELSGTNQLLRGYEWGLQLEAVRDFTVNSFGIFHYYGHDGHGSVRWLTNASGVISDTYDYDAFGNLISSTGATFNNYLFAGEQFDPALGIYYNRARYYDQRQGRFWTADTFEGSRYDPASLHKYLYAGANPVSHRDPSGRDFDIISKLNSLAIEATLFVQNTAVRLAIAFATGGAAAGRLFNQLGAVAEDIADEVAELVAAANPETIQSIERDVEELETGGARRFLDIAIRTSQGLKDILIEVKYSIPTEGEALARLAGQVNAALRTGNDVVVWALRSPTARELSVLAEELGNDFSRIKVLSGPENLFNYIQALLK